jgi:MFS transporter, DHA1 family, inner membrane transport protein
VPGLQSRVMRYAAQAPTLASGANIAAFNLGNALGAFAGGLAITAGLGYTSPIWVGALITLAALVVMTVAAVTARSALGVHPGEAADVTGSASTDTRPVAASVA